MSAWLDAGSLSVQQILIVVCAAVATIFDGMDNQFMGFAVPAIARDWHIQRSAFSSVLAVGLIGVSVGSTVGGWIADRIGRRPAFLLSILVFAGATLAMADGKSITFFLILRFVAGLGIGGALPIAATIAAEFTPAKSRSAMIVLTIVCVPFGGLLAGVVSSIVLPAHGWRPLFLIGGLAPLVALLVFLAAVPETPRFLAMKANSDKLRKVLRRIGHPVAHDVVMVEESAPVRGRGMLRALFSGARATDTPILWLLFFFNLTSVYLAFNWLPSVLTGYGLGLRGASEGLSAYNFGGIVGAVSFAFIVNRFGSRMPLILGAVASSASALVCAALSYFHQPLGLVLLGSVAIHGLFVNAVQTSLYAVAAQLYPTDVRATGVAAAVTLGRLGAILSAFLGGALLALPTQTYYLILGVAMGGVWIGLVLLKGHIPARGLQTTMT